MLLGGSRQRSLPEAQIQAKADESTKLDQLQLVEVEAKLAAETPPRRARAGAHKGREGGSATTEDSRHPRAGPSVRRAGAGGRDSPSLAFIVSSALQ